MYSKDDTSTTNGITLAKWTDRFFAWLIDYLIITIPLLLLSGTFYVDETSSEQTDIEITSDIQLEYFIVNFVFLVYWTYFEYTTGQSLGKKILKLKTIDINGYSLPTLKSALIESAGKSFLLPIDLILGLIFTNKNRQRIFNRLSNTIVIKLKNTQSSYYDKNFSKD
ncbi:MAG: RDD family protein [Nitrososphaeraceae archaeon]